MLDLAMLREIVDTFELPERVAQKVFTQTRWHYERLERDEFDRRYDSGHSLLFVSLIEFTDLLQSLLRSILHQLRENQFEGG